MRLKCQEYLQLVPGAIWMVICGDCSNQVAAVLEAFSKK